MFNNQLRSKTKAESKSTVTFSLCHLDEQCTHKCYIVFDLYSNDKNIGCLKRILTGNDGGNVDHDNTCASITVFHTIKAIFPSLRQSEIWFCRCFHWTVWCTEDIISCQISCCKTWELCLLSSHLLSRRFCSYDYVSLRLIIYKNLIHLMWIDHMT